MYNRAQVSPHCKGLFGSKCQYVVRKMRNPRLVRAPSGLLLHLLGITPGVFVSFLVLGVTIISPRSSARDLESTIFLQRWLGLPWWRCGCESACQCRGHGFEPWSGGIPRAAEQLGSCATTTEPARLEPVLRNRRGSNSSRPTHRDEEWPPLATTGERPHTERKRRCNTAKKINK